MSILARLRANGGDVCRDEYQFRINPGKLSSAAIDWLKQPARRHALCLELWPLFDDWIERAAIREYDGGQDRESAERDAYWEVMAR